jgi:4-hydroxyphenylpyruvate dioxygenase-like putative hemolysin
LLQGTFAFRNVPATFRVDDTAAALNTAVEVGAVKVEADAYRRHALDSLKATGEILLGCVHQGEREHFAVRFGKDSSSNAGDE